MKQTLRSKIDSIVLLTNNLQLTFTGRNAISDSYRKCTNLDTQNEYDLVIHVPMSQNKYAPTFGNRRKMCLF